MEKAGLDVLGPFSLARNAPPAYAHGADKSGASPRGRGYAEARTALGRTRRVHFIGIGGIGMSGIAELLTNLGYAVSGSDQRASDVTARLKQLGVVVHEGHAAEHVGDADVVVVSSAVPEANPEIAEARRRQIPVIPRAEMLAELMRLRYGIAVAGAHGKTTTTSMVALMLERNGLDPTAVIGGRLSAFGSNARLGHGEYMVAEADESDGSFLKLSPTLAVITNVDREHLEHYGSYEHLLNAFVTFANRVPFYGSVVLCADDPRLRELRSRITRRVCSYGLFAPDADLRGTHVHLESFGGRCLVSRAHPTGGADELGWLTLQVPGRHNLSNALAAIAVGLELGLEFDGLAKALGEFRGAERRFEVLGTVGQVTVVDDYGHHPTEIKAVIDAARVANAGRLIVVFQPHRYTRTKLLASEFGNALAGADYVVLTDVYAAGEQPLAGATSDAIAEALRSSSAVPVRIVDELSEVIPTVIALVRPGDMVITLGAGSIGAVGPKLIRALTERESSLEPKEAADGR